LSRIAAALARAGLPPLERSAWVEVDVDALVTNTRALASIATPAAVAPVVKADGYGHGLEMAARCAVAGGARWLCVADAGEAQRLRADGYAGRVFVLYPIPAEMAPAMAQLGIDVTVGGSDDVSALTSALGPDDGTLSVHVEVDTGMTRGGERPSGLVETVGQVMAGEVTRLEGVWTHLAAPEDDTTTTRQIEVFTAAVDSLAEAGIAAVTLHVAASGGLITIDTSGHDLTRPGLAFYGVDPEVEGALPEEVRPALAVRALPVRVEHVPAGTAVGYAGTWVASRPSIIATLPIGYADGWARSSSPGTGALVEGGMAPVVGRISSDSLTVDVTDVEIGPGSEFTLMGRTDDGEIACGEVAAVRGTITWEVLQTLGSRLSRVYVSGDEVVAMRPESTTNLLSTLSAPSHPPRRPNDRPH
jgi:alanine racemase